MATSEFQFELGQKVRLAPPEAVGEVVGRAQFSSRKAEYLVRYFGGHGQVEIWFAAEALRAA